MSEVSERQSFPRVLCLPYWVGPAEAATHALREVQSQAELCSAEVPSPGRVSVSSRGEQGHPMFTSGTQGDFVHLLGLCVVSQVPRWGLAHGGRS